MHQGAGRGEASIPSVTNKQPTDNISPSGWLAIAVAIVPFYLKRALLLGQHDYIIWLTADYSARIISLIGVAMARRSGLFTPARPTAGIFTSILIFIGLLAAEFYLHAFVYPVLRVHFNYFELWRFPSIPNPRSGILILHSVYCSLPFPKKVSSARFCFHYLKDGA
jgi:hypothetical protein